MAADLTSRLPDRVERMGVKRDAYSTEIVQTDGGGVHTNSRWAQPLAAWDITTPPMRRNDADYLAVKALFDEARGSALSFPFKDIEACGDVVVRFVGDELAFQPVGNMVSLVFSVAEAR